MSLIGDSLSTALSVLNTAASQPTIEYRAGTTGAWTEISGCHFHRDEAIREYESQGAAESDIEREVAGYGQVALDALDKFVDEDTLPGDVRLALDAYRKSLSDQEA